MNVSQWLLDGDPAIRWQVLRDLVGAPAEKVARERGRVACEGWGARLLDRQEADGSWAGGAYAPRGYDWPEQATGQPWTATAHTLALLRDLGVDPADERVAWAVELVRDNVKWEEGGQDFFAGEVEPCVNGLTVSVGVYFGIDVSGIVERLLRDRLADGGWNCWAPTTASFASTVNVLEGLLAYERATGVAIAERRAAEEYLLERGLFRRKRTGDVADSAWLEFSFPARWHYDVLRALEYFRTTAEPPDPRVSEALDIVRSKRSPDGTWPLENTHPGDAHFHLEGPDGAPSRWNTLRALRVLGWAAGQSSGSEPVTGARASCRAGPIAQQVAVPAATWVRPAS
ncbi:hypothetical protein [Dactylosporangium sp. CA-233914]|uniref:hypothetical protein n=1 Tax=Dactylosporangium sp. CA-233914 TaxID=3239934 RepID=UPI003D8C9E89